MKITHVKPIVENSKNLAIEVGSRVKTPDGTGTVRHIEAMEGYDVKSLKRHDDIICFVDLDSGKLEFYMINEVQPITQPGQYVFPEPKGMMEDDVTEVTPALQPGSKIRTKKAGMEGEVAKIENGIVFFQLGDGRMMKTSESNVVPVEKLEDEEFEEGGMGGFNRCAPSTDVSYEKVLDEVIGAWEDANQPEQERRAGPKPEPVPGLNRPKAEKIANAMEIRLNDTIYVYKLVKGMISLEEVPPAVRMAIYKLVDGMPTDQSGALKPFVMDKLRQVVAESRIQEEVERLSGLYEKEGPCWKGYKQVGMKKKGGKKVPNCVPNK